MHARVGVYASGLACLQKNLRNGRKWSWQLSAAVRFCTMSTMLFVTWRICW